tara:strand:+ start:129 stop:572 length:444 start_codon:yes stop_codon:yes gene_type:complete
MANIDAKWEFSSADSISADAYSENVVDLGANVGSNPQIGGLFLNVVMTTGFTSCTSIDVLLRSGTGTDGTDLNAGVFEVMSALVVSSDRDLATDGLVLVSASVPLAIVARYLQVYYDVDTPSGTAVIDAWMGLSPINQSLTIQEEPS